MTAAEELQSPRVVAPDPIAADLREHDGRSPPVYLAMEFPRIPSVLIGVVGNTEFPVLELRLFQQGTHYGLGSEAEASRLQVVGRGFPLGIFHVL